MRYPEEHTSLRTERVPLCQGEAPGPEVHWRVPESEGERRTGRGRRTTRRRRTVSQTRQLKAEAE